MFGAGGGRSDGRWARKDQYALYCTCKYKKGTITYCLDEKTQSLIFGCTTCSAFIDGADHEKDRIFPRYEHSYPTCYFPVYVYLTSQVHKKPKPIPPCLIFSHVMS